jgi:hypothetical protein
MLPLGSEETTGAPFLGDWIELTEMQGVTQVKGPTCSGDPALP